MQRPYCPLFHLNHDAAYFIVPSAQTRYMQLAVVLGSECPWFTVNWNLAGLRLADW